MAANLFEQFKRPVGAPPLITGIRLVPSSGGVFEVSVAGELVFSKSQLGRHAEPGEVEGLVASRLNA